MATLTKYEYLRHVFDDWKAGCLNTRDCIRYGHETSARISDRVHHKGKRYNIGKLICQWKFSSDNYIKNVKFKRTAVCKHKDCMNPHHVKPMGYIR